MLSLFNVIAMFLFAVATPLVEEQHRVYTRVTVGVLVEAYAVLDCLDGSLARATKQTSKIGEVLDHWCVVAAAAAAAAACSDAPAPAGWTRSACR